MCAVNCGQLASTRTSWANKAKGIVVGTARLVEVANLMAVRRVALTRVVRQHGAQALFAVVVGAGHGVSKPQRLWAFGLDVLNWVHLR